jgi:hypothetical protein
VVLIAERFEGERVMDDELFASYKECVDHDIDADDSGQLGIAMGFGLAGEFLKRGLLETVKFRMLVDWESKTYRDRHIFPNPWMDEYDHKLGSS